MRAFAQYFDGKPSGLNPPAIIRNNPYFQELRLSISESVSKDFVAARDYVKVGEVMRGKCRWRKAFKCRSGDPPSKRLDI